MKKLTLSIGLAFLSLGVFAQQAQLESAKNAYNNKDYATVITQVEEAESLLPDSRIVEPKDIAEAYYFAGEAARKKGDMAKAAQFFSKLREVETKPYFEAKNKDTREVEYFFDKATAEKVTNAGDYRKLKERTLGANYINKVTPELNKLVQTDIQEANNAFQAKNYEKAYKKFLESYYIYKALGTENKLLAYYAGVGALQTDQYKKEAAEIFQKLIDEGFTGVQTRYIAKAKDTGEEVAFASKSDMDTQVKLGLYVEPREETSESLEEELYNNLVYAYYVTEDYDNGVKVAQQGLSKFPENDNINQMLSSMYYKSGNLDDFIADLKKKDQNGTANAADYFNLAKMLDDNGEDKETVVSYYKKSIEKDPAYGNSYLNLALVITEPEKEYVEKMNANLGSSKKEQKIYNENAAKRKELYVEALPYLEKAYELSPDDVNLIKVLQNAYDVMGQDDKYMELKKKLESMSN